MAQIGAFWWLAAVPTRGYSCRTRGYSCRTRGYSCRTRGYSCLNILYFLAKANKKRLSVLFHLFRRVASNRLFITRHLIDKTSTKPLQIATG
jgi:hypothetical protein